jgi:hypothetical protein
MAQVQGSLPRDNNSEPIQLVVGSRNRTNLTAGVASSNAALPTGSSGLVIVRCTDYVWLNFGTSGVTASAAATSILCAPGEGVYPLVATDTHFAGQRVGSTDVVVQVESLATV